MERRSNRQKKSVNYRQILEVNSGESDDDFAGPPPPKRTKNTTTVKSVPDQHSDVPKTKRLSREEKTYNRALEQALKVSQVASGTTSVLSEVSDASDTISKDEEGDEFIPDDDEPDLTDHEEEGVSDENDDSDFNSSPPTKTKSVKKHQAKRTLSTIKQKSPANGKSKKSLPKLSRTPKDEVQTNMTSNSTPATPKGSTVLETNLKLVTQKAVGPSTPKSCPPSSVSRNIGIGRKVPKWTPPSRVGEGSKLPNTVNTSGTPVIRVGLSRHARVKPLHVSRT